jgi:hypothetical protein
MTHTVRQTLCIQESQARLIVPRFLGAAEWCFFFKKSFQVQTPLVQSAGKFRRMDFHVQL